MKVQHAMLLLGSLVWASGAKAEDGTLSPSSSSGSVNVSVYIPPLGAALAAAKAGAIGLWSISGRNNGLMIQLHQSAAEEGYEAVSVYSRAEVGIEAAWLAEDRLTGVITTKKQGGLVQSTISVPAGTVPIRTLMIRGI